MKKKLSDDFFLHLIEGIALASAIVIVAYMVNKSDQKKVPKQYRASIKLLDK
jgi:hypothetical protein